MKNVFLGCVILLGSVCGLFAQEEVDGNYIIGESDVLSVDVRKEPEYTAKAITVRVDGMISLPTLGDIHASGKTVKQLEDEIAEKLKEFLIDPIVQVFVDKVVSHWVTVAGQVSRVSQYALTGPTTVLEVIVRAGGPLPTAKTKDIKIIRYVNGKEIQIPFNYKEVIQGKNMSQNILLKNRDTILVP